MARKSSNLHIRFEVIIFVVDGDVLCLLLVEVLVTQKQPPRLRLEYINEIQVEQGTLPTENRR